MIELFEDIPDDVFAKSIAPKEQKFIIRLPSALKSEKSEKVTLKHSLLTFNPARSSKSETSLVLCTDNRLIKSFHQKLALFDIYKKINYKRAHHSEFQGFEIMPFINVLSLAVV